MQNQIKTVITKYFKNEEENNQNVIIISLSYGVQANKFPKEDTNP
jgi:hypothetical protein